MKCKIFIISFLLIILFSRTIFSQEQTVRTKDGVSISFQVSGTGEPALIFVHGWCCDRSYWSGQEKEFAKKYKIVTIDLAGHGNSGMERKNYTVELFGEDVAAVVNNLGIRKSILVGHSMGGAIVIEAAGILGDKVIGLIGADTFQNLGETIPGEEVELFLKPFKENFPVSARGFVKTMFPPGADPDLVKKISDDISAAPPEAALSTIENVFKYNLVPALGKINVPVISINCDLYPIREDENRKYVKSFEVKMMKGVGHFVMLEDPEKFNSLLRESIEQLIKMQ